jgi:hypothetical protein
MKAVPKKLVNGFLCLLGKIYIQKGKRVELYGRFLKMIDDFTNPFEKTNHKYRSRSTLYMFMLISN